MPPSYVKNKAINQMEIEDRQDRTDRTDRTRTKDQQDLSPLTVPGHCVVRYQTRPHEVRMLLFSPLFFV